MNSDEEINQFARIKPNEKVKSNTSESTNY